MFAKYIIIQTTYPNIDEANKISNILLESKLSPCIQMQKISSNYCWQGKIEKNDEILVQIKSKRRNFKKIANLIQNHHSYETPEIISIPLAQISLGYEKWLKNPN